MKKTLPLFLFIFFISGCANIHKKEEIQDNLYVQIEYIGPKIDIKHLKYHRKNDIFSTYLTDRPRNLGFEPPAYGIICYSEDICHHFYQNSIFVVEAIKKESVKITWKIFSGREINYSLEMLEYNHQAKYRIPNSIPSIQDSNIIINTIVSLGEEKKLNGPYDTEISIRVIKKQ